MTREELKQMVNTCNQYHSCAACPYNPEDISRFIGDRWKGGCPNYDRKLVYAMGKGYGDVSEYEAEIERLKADKKQAQIDVLNKLKDSYGLYYLSAFGVKERMLADILNPMIEELKK